MRRGRGSFFPNRSLVRNASAAPTTTTPDPPGAYALQPPAPSTPKGFVRRGNSLIKVSAVSSSVPRSSLPPSVPKPPPVLPPPSANPPSVKLKYSFHRPPPLPQPLPPRGYAPRGRGRGSGGPRRQPPSTYVSPSHSFLHRALNRKARNLTLKTAAKSGLPLSSKISKDQQLSVAGVQYRVSKGGNRLVRVSGDSSTPKKALVQGSLYVRSKNGMSLVRQQRRPVEYVTQLIPGHRKAKDCYLWLRTGKCSRMATCRNRHDPERVAVCRKFLQGECQDQACPLQHKLSARDQMMPVCSFFLKGLCTNERCIYSHVKVNPDAEVCKGFCPEGSSCTKLHTNVCQEFKHTGKCPRGAKCKLRHPVAKRRRLEESAKKPKKPRSVLEEEKEEGHDLREIKATEGALAVAAQEADVGRRSVMPGSILPNFDAPPASSDIPEAHTDSGGCSDLEIPEKQ